MVLGLVLGSMVQKMDSEDYSARIVGVEAHVAPCKFPTDFEAEFLGCPVDLPRAEAQEQCEVVSAEIGDALRSIGALHHHGRPGCDQD